MSEPRQHYTLNDCLCLNNSDPKLLLPPPNVTLFAHRSYFYAMNKLNQVIVLMVLFRVVSLLNLVVIKIGVICSPGL